MAIIYSDGFDFVDVMKDWKPKDSNEIPEGCWMEILECPVAHALVPRGEYAWEETSDGRWNLVKRKTN